MDRLAQRGLRSFLDVLEVINSVLDRAAFPPRAVSAICALVDCDVAAFLVVDCPTWRLTECAQEPADLVFPGMEQAFEEHLCEHPLVGHYVRTGEGGAVKMSDFVTLPQFRALGIYQDFYRRLDVQYQIGIGLRLQLPQIVWIELSRRARDFSERDRALLNVLRPHLIQALRNVDAMARMQERSTLYRQAADQHDLGLIVITPELEVRRVTPRAADLLARYFPGTGSAELPPPVLAWGRQQEQLVQAKELSGLREPLLVEGPDMCLTIRMVAGSGRRLLVAEEVAKVQHPTSLDAFGLTPREVEVLTRVCQGKNNVEIAQTLRMSARTVGKHLEHIFAKLGVETRTAAATRAVGLLGSQSS